MRLFITVFAFLLSGFLLAQSTFECCKKGNDLIAFLNYFHVQPVPIDSTFSKNLFNDFFYQLDPQKRILCAPDVLSLTSYSNQLHDVIRRNDPAFFLASSQLFKTKLKEYEAWLVRYLSKPFDFTVKQHVNIFPETGNLPETRALLEQVRILFLKHEALEYIYQKSKLDFTAHDFKLLEAEARSHLLKKERASIERLLNPENEFEDYIHSVFLTSIAQQFDPHTTYMSPTETKAFESSLSVEGLSFGFDLNQNEEGEFIIERVVPAGPAWNSNEVNQGDILIEIQIKDGKKIDMEFTDIDEAIEILNSPEVQEADIRIRKPDGQIKTVSLVKQKVEQAQQVIQSFVLQGERKIGYISLPGFYKQWENTEAPGCASDMAKELLKLKKEKIEGLIVDLRFNGGGSLDEALELAGIFIDVGPLSIIKEAGQVPLTLKDENKGTIYDGPLAIMVNGFSASASELFTATLQDYNRAIVVGTPTFGKATGQVILPLTDPNRIGSADGEDGFVKVTIDKIYRITGKSYQLSGVQPHIVLPDFTTSVPEKEIFYPHSFLRDSISKKTYYTPGTSLPVQLLKENSEKRIGQSLQFNQITEVTRNMLEPVALSLSDFRIQKEKINELLDSIEATRPPHSFTANATLFDSTLLSLDDDRSAQNQKISKELERSIYIAETYRILCDFLVVSKK